MEISSAFRRSYVFRFLITVTTQCSFSTCSISLPRQWEHPVSSNCRILQPCYTFILPKLCKMLLFSIFVWVGPSWFSQLPSWFAMCPNRVTSLKLLPAISLEYCFHPYRHLFSVSLIGRGMLSPNPTSITNKWYVMCQYDVYVRRKTTYEQLCRWMRARKLHQTSSTINSSNIPEYARVLLHFGIRSTDFQQTIVIYVTSYKFAHTWHSLSWNKILTVICIIWRIELCQTKAVLFLIRFIA